MSKTPPKGKIKNHILAEHKLAITLAMYWLDRRFGKLIDEVIAEQFLRDLGEPLEELQGDIPALMRDQIEANKMEFFMTEGMIREGEGTPFRTRDALFSPTGPRLIPRHKRYLKKLCSQPLRLYEVVSIWPGEGLELRDLERPRAPIRWVSREGASGEGEGIAGEGAHTLVMGARLIDCKDAWTTSGACYLFFQPEPVDHLLDVLKGIRKKRIPAEQKQLERSQAIRDVWLMVLITLLVPEIRHFFGAAPPLPSILVLDRYELLDREGLEQALEAMPGVVINEEDEEEEDKSWTLFEDADDIDPRRLLFIVIANNKPGHILTFADKQSLADPGREWFAKVAGDRVLFLERKTIDLRAEPAESDPSEEPPGTEEP